MLGLLQGFQIINTLDLVSLTIAIWTLWVAFFLKLGGALQRAFRVIAIGTLIFALSHIVDALIAELHLLPGQTSILVHQCGVLAATMLFVTGIGRLAGELPKLSSSPQEASFSLLWPLVIGLVICVAAFSFILYGLSLEAAVVAFIGIDGCLIFLICLCCVLLLRARIGGVVGRSLWLAFLGLLFFGLAHPLQTWTLFEKPSTPLENAILHRLIVVPAFLLFASSLTVLARSLNRIAVQDVMASLQQGQMLAQVPASPSVHPIGDLGVRIRMQPTRRPAAPDWRNTGGLGSFDQGKYWPR